MTTISLKEYKFKKMEHEYFDFYKHIEEYFDEKITEKDVMLRMYLTVRYLEDIAVTIHKYLQTDEASDSIRKIAKAESKWIKGIAEVLK